MASGWIEPDEWVAGGNGQIGWVLVPIYALTTLNSITSTASSPVQDTYQRCWDLDTLSYTEMTRDSQQVLWYYPSTTLSSPWSSWPTAVMIGTSTAFATPVSGYNYLDILCEDTFPADDHHAIAQLFGDGQLTSAIPSQNYLKFTPNMDTPGLSLVVLNEDVYQYNAFEIINSDANADDEKIETWMHGVLVPLPPGHEYARTYQYQHRSHNVSPGVTGRMRWLGYGNNGLRRSLTLRWGALDETNRDLLYSIYEALKGGLPCWYCEDLTDNDTWFQAVIPDVSVQEVSADLWEASLTLEGV